MGAHPGYIKGSHLSIYIFVSYTYTYMRCHCMKTKGKSELKHDTTGNAMLICTLSADLQISMGE